MEEQVCPCCQERPTGATCEHCKAGLCIVCMEEEGHKQEFVCVVCRIRKCHYDLWKEDTCYHCDTASQVMEIARLGPSRTILNAVIELSGLQLSLGKQPNE